LIGRDELGVKRFFALGAFLVLGVTEVPVEGEVLALGVAYDALAVAAELRIVRRE
jgi:hypothetical protein